MPAGNAMFTRHDAHTRRIINDFTARLDKATDAAVLAAAAALDGNRHPLAPELRRIVDKELAARHLSLAPLAVTR